MYTPDMTIRIGRQNGSRQESFAVLQLVYKTYFNDIMYSKDICYLKINVTRVIEYGDRIRPKYGLSSNELSSDRTIVSSNELPNNRTTSFSNEHVLAE